MSDKSRVDVLPYRKYLARVKSIILDSSILIIASHQAKQSIFSRRFLLILFALILPLFVQVVYEPAPIASTKNDLKEFYDPFEAKYLLNLFSPLDVERVPFGNLASLIFIIFLILSCSEFVAQEYEEKTISMLLVKPLRRSDIILGKLLGFISLLSIAQLFIFIGHAAALTWQMQASSQAFLQLTFSSIPIFQVLFMLGVSFIASFMMLLSTYFNKGLHAALTGTFLYFGDEIFVKALVGPEYRLPYQLGIITEEFIAITNENLYLGDYLFSLDILVVLITIFLLASMIIFYRREFP